MNITPATHTVVRSDCKRVLDPTGRILLFGGPQLLGHSMSKGPNVLLIQGEYVSTRSVACCSPRQLCRDIVNRRGPDDIGPSQRGQTVLGEVFRHLLVVYPYPRVAANLRTCQGTPSQRLRQCPADRIVVAQLVSKTQRSVIQHIFQRYGWGGCPSCRPQRHQPRNAQCDLQFPGVIDLRQPVVQRHRRHRNPPGVSRNRSRAPRLCHLRHRFFVAHQPVESHQRVSEVQM